MLFAYIAGAAGMACTTRSLLLQILADALGAAVAAFIFLSGFLWAGEGEMSMSLLLAALLAPLAAIGSAVCSLLLGGLGDLIGRRSAADRLIGGVGTILGAAIFTTFFLVLVENFNVGAGN
jgi:MFS family permease